MTYSSPNSRIIKSRIIDWYDGIVWGLVLFEDDPSWFLCFLVAWEQKKNLRAYAFLRISNEEENQLNGLCDSDIRDKEKKWRTIKTYVNKIVRNYDGLVEVLVGGDLGTEPINKMAVSVHDIAKELGRDVSFSITDEQLKHYKFK